MGLGSTSANTTTLKVADLPQASLPLIDLAPLYAATTPTAKRATLATVGAQVRDACLDTGFFMIKNHGIEGKLIKRVIDGAGMFFDAPREEKLEYKKEVAKNITGGYFGVGEENLDPTNQPIGDFKEGFDVNRQLSVDDPNYGKPMRLPNRLPDDKRFPGLSSTLMEYFREAHQLGMTLLAVFEHAMGVPADTLTPFFAEPMTMLRCLRYYPSTPPISLSQLGCGAHSDYGTCAILAQDSPGLQLFDHARDQWVRVPHIPGTLVVNIGDMTSRWTNGEFKSTVHRVVNVNEDGKGKVRHSLVFFFEPEYDTEVDVLEPFIGDGKRFEKVTFGDHLRNMYSGSWKDEEKSREDGPLASSP
ncbi:hypothetical protein DFJ77DRAFT_31924 [Powellomyces hirtus]|nr:hypothetical protein DFJ77DRAFT_31924 [Powellomyces hirtus]